LLTSKFDARAAFSRLLLVCVKDFAATAAHLVIMNIFAPTLQYFALFAVNSVSVQLAKPPVVLTVGLIRLMRPTDLKIDRWCGHAGKATWVLSGSFTETGEWSCKWGAYTWSKTETKL